MKRFVVVWRRFWAAAPRQLKVTRAGRVLVALAFTTGFAAINTGNNLLFLGWGLVLSAIVLSGVLSEAALRDIDVTARPPESPRAGEVVALPLFLSNGSRVLPSFALELAAVLEDAAVVEAPFQFRMGPGEARHVAARYVPARRGRHVIAALVARTSYPFGFFEKSRRYDAAPSEFFVAPAVVDVTALVEAVLERDGEAPAGRPGSGEDFFALRPFKDGDEERRVHWRRTARTGRRVVRETEARHGRAILVEIVVGADGAVPGREHVVATATSLAEELLQRGHDVAILAPGTFVPFAGGGAQRRIVLEAMARLELGAATPSMPRHIGAHIVLAPPGVPPRSGAHWLVVSEAA